MAAEVFDGGGQGVAINGQIAQEGAEFHHGEIQPGGVLVLKGQGAPIGWHLGFWLPMGEGGGLTHQGGGEAVHGLCELGQGVHQAPLPAAGAREGAAGVAAAQAWPLRARAPVAGCRGLAVGNGGGSHQRVT